MKYTSNLEHGRVQNGHAKSPTITKRINTLIAVLFAAAVPGFFLPEVAQGETITGVTIEDVSSELGAPFDRQANFLLDSSGFDEVTGFHTVAPDGFMWLNTGTFAAPNDPNVPGAIITFDLEDNYNLDSLTVWNYNEVAQFLARGANDVEILVAASEGGAFTALGDFTFDIAPGVEDVDFGQVIDLSGFAAANNVRLVRFNITSNHGGDNNFVGLSEVRFDAAPAGVVVFPATFSSAASQGTAVGTLMTPQGDAGDTFAYAFIAGEGDTDNGKFQIVGDELQAGWHDFGTATDGETFSVRIRSTGSPSGDQFESNIIITITADSDADNLPDAWEEMWAGVGNLSVLSGLGDANADGDTLTDLEEYELRVQFPNLDPTEADSDGDTLNDGDEIAGAGLRPPTDPTNPDTDGDTLADGVETNTGVFSSASDTGSDPTLVDTDGDTISDAVEVALGSDPNDPASTPPVALVGYWPFDTDNDPQPDLSGFFNDAAVAAGASWVNDPDRGGVMEFDGNDSYLEAADSESLSVTGDITIAAWVNVTDFTNWRGIVGKSVNNLPASYDLYLVLNDGRARLYTGSPSGFAQVTATTVPALSEWHHVAVTRIGDDVTFYYDGQLDGQGTTTQPMLDSDATLRIGNRADLVTDFLGRMDDVAIFSGGLSADQVAAVKDGDFSEFGIGSSGFAITEIDYIENYNDTGQSAVSLSFSSRPGRRYAVDISTSLSEKGSWTEIDDGIESEGAVTTYVDTFFARNATRLFYRIREPQ